MKNLPLKMRLMHFAIQKYFGFLSFLFPAIATRLSYNMFFKPQRFAAPKKEQDVMITAKKRSIEHNSKQIQVYEWGTKGPVILFHHGWNGRGTQVAHFLQALLDKGFRVVAFDGPAHGKSTGTNTNLLEFSEIVKKLSDHYGEIEAVIAHSFGGMVSSFSLYRHSLAINKVVSIAAPFSMKSVISAYGAAINIPSKIQDRFLARLEKQFNIKWIDFSGETTVPNHTIPALIIHDKQDLDVAYSEAVAMNSHWKDSRLITTDGLGHRRILKDNKIIEEVVSFVQA